MKKLLIFCCCFLFAIIPQAQQLQVRSTVTISAADFCSTVGDIMKHAHNSFEEINTDKDADPEDPTGEDEDPDVSHISLARKASIDFPGAKTSNIVMGLFDPDKYMAYFGTYKIKAEADKKINTLKVQLTACLKGYKLTVKPGKLNGMDYVSRYLFDEKKTGNATPQHIELVMTKDVVKVKKKPVIIYRVCVYIHGLKPLGKD